MPIRFPFTTVKGSPLPQNFRKSGRFDPTRGYVYTYDWKGADQQLAENLWQWYASQGIATTLTFEADKAELVAIDSTSEYSIDSWEIVANEIQLDLFADPDFLAAISTFVNTATYANAWLEDNDEPVPTVYDIIADLRQNLQNNVQVRSLANDSMLTPIFDDDPEVWSWIADYYWRQQQGAESFEVVQYVLKHKFNISNRSGLFIYDFGTNQVYTPAEMLSEVSDYSLWIFPLPPRLQFKLASIPPMTAPPAALGYPESYLWGWLKSGSTETTEAQNRVNVEVNYSLYLWDTYIYDPYAGGTGGGSNP